MRTLAQVNKDIINQKKIIKQQTDNYRAIRDKYGYDSDEAIKERRKLCEVRGRLYDFKKEKRKIWNNLMRGIK